jgi:hypothetical protein
LRSFWPSSSLVLAREDFFALEVAAIGDNIERVGLKNGLGLPGHVRKLRPV